MSCQQDKFHSLGLVYRHAQQICVAVIVMHYLVKAVKGRITNDKQCPIITASPEEHGRVKLAQRHNQMHTALTNFAHGKSGGGETCMTADEGCPRITFKNTTFLLFFPIQIPLSANMLNTVFTLLVSVTSVRTPLSHVLPVRLRC